MSCRFCRDLKDIKEINERYPWENGEREHYKVRVHYYATRNRQRHGEYTFNEKYPINFCPECGKALKKRRKTNARQTEGM